MLLKKIQITVHYAIATKKKILIRIKTFPDNNLSKLFTFLYVFVLSTNQQR